MTGQDQDATQPIPTVRFTAHSPMYHPQNEVLPPFIRRSGNPHVERPRTEFPYFRIKIVLQYTHPSMEPPLADTGRSATADGILPIQGILLFVACT